MAPKKNHSKKETLTVPDSGHIVFEGEKKQKKGKGPPPNPPDPTKPTARQVIGGASWTGKLPVNLLSEFCQRQKWNKPDYSMRQLPSNDGGERMYRSDVTLSKTDPRTKETTRLPPIKLPPSEAHLADQSTALEARHFAATYALFRIQSMKNIHMTLPPQYRDLWKGEFSRLKKQDTDDGHGWKYQEDPFEAESKRQEIHRAMEKRKESEKSRKDLADGEDGLTKGPGVGGPSRTGPESKLWDRAPTVAMGQQIRDEVEELIRNRAVWNQNNVSLSDQERNSIFTNVADLGFRDSHVREAIEFCKDQEEVLEWLLVHVPEDDLPKWTFPPNYNAGVILASGDHAKEAKLKRLALAGYPADLCARALRDANGDENLAAFKLQQLLVPATDHPDDAVTDSRPAWKEETDTLEAIFGDNFRQSGGSQCSIKMSTQTDQAFTVHFKCPQTGYPHHAVPAISIEIPNIPAYVCLSATRQAIRYAQSELIGEVMMYDICQWLETELPNIIDHPGQLSELRINSRVTPTEEIVDKGKDGERNVRTSQKRIPNRRRQQNQQTDSDMLDRWRARQLEAGQISMIKIRQGLPAWKKAASIVQSIQNKQITIISGETGSGKSTQVVQFVLDNAIEELRGSKANIICTQPRRVATLSLADRVSNERCSQVGDEVGYVIRGEAKVSGNTKITFMTTGVLLRRLQSSSSIKEALADVSHVFIDEVHERSLDTDFLLALLKESAEENPELRIILMSATLDAEIFSRYFGGPKKVALVNIEGRTHPVHDFFLEDAVKTAHPALSEPEITKTIQNLGFGIKYDLIRDLVFSIDEDLGESPGSILIFLPGTMEIDQCLRAVSNSSKIYGLPLHASLLPADQRKVFLSAPAGRRKVVAATNVAETSITIDDVVAVIDTGRVKETSYDADNNIVRLTEGWASQAACKQRRGRAGRVRTGVCYKLFTKSIEEKMPPKNLPEIQRVPLEQLCLSVKATRADCDVADFISRTLTPPDSSAVSNAIKSLHTMNVLESNRLTALGMCLALIPADLRCAKLLVYGALFDCLEACVTIASILTVKSPFVSPRDKREEATEARLRFIQSHGDLVLDMRAYEEWSQANHTMRHRELQDWCSDRYISAQTMRDISSTRRQLLDSLKDAGLVPLTYKSPTQVDSVVDKPHELVLLTALIAASLQPQLALISFPSKKYIASMSGAKELDPEARTIKFFIPDESSEIFSNNVTPLSSRPGTPKPNSAGLGNKISPLSRVFVHPASCLFSAQTFPSHSTYVSYFTKMVTSKPFIRELTPLNVYSLLLFGGHVELDTAGRGLTIGTVWRVQGWARIGVLISRLRVLLDEELRSAVEDGGVLLGRMSGSKVVQVVRRLLVLNGQDR